MALAGLQHGLRMVSQPAVRFYNRVGYHDYEGITEDFGERARINKALGKNRALIMRNYGLRLARQTAREAFVLMKSLIEAADIQLKMEAAGGDLIEIPAEICEKTARTNTSIMIPAAARPIGRRTCACSTPSIRSGGIERRSRNGCGRAGSRRLLLNVGE